MKVKSKNGIVEFRMVAGSSIVESVIPEAAVQTILNSGKEITETNDPKFTVCVDGKWFFPAIIEKKKPKVMEEPTVTPEVE